MKKLFTHSDLDGAGCAALLSGEFSVETTFCSYSDVDSLVTEFCVSLLLSGTGSSKYDGLWLTDISVSEHTAELVDSIKGRIDVKLIDHHTSAKRLEKYDWVTVGDDETSATELVWSGFGSCCGAKIFAKTVGAWDCQRTTHPYYEKGLEFNALAKVCGLKWVVDRGAYPLKGYERTFAKAALAEMERRMEKYAEGVTEVVTEAGNVVGVVLTPEPATVQMGRILGARYPYVVIVDTSRWTISLVTQGKDFNMATLAEGFGGGGHPKAAGFEIPTFREALLYQIFEYLKVKKL